MGIKTTLNFVLISKLLGKMRINCSQERYRQNNCAKLEFVGTNLQNFLTNNFFWVHFFPVISMDLESA
jgi:hypothetical protein